MICTRCRRKLGARQTRCRHCGQPVPDAGSGVFQTSAVLISSQGTEVVYRSVDEVPDPLRSKLLKSTNSRNSATILIADRRGRQEIAKVLRSLPASAPRGMLQALLSGEAPAPAAAWFTPKRKKLILALIVLLVLALIAFVFHPWWPWSRPFSLQPPL
jgi:hypothetical protein